MNEPTPDRLGIRGRRPNPQHQEWVDTVRSLPAEEVLVLYPGKDFEKPLRSLYSTLRSWLIYNKVNDVSVHIHDGTIVLKHAE